MKTQIEHDQSTQLGSRFDSLFEVAVEVLANTGTNTSSLERAVIVARDFLQRAKLVLPNPESQLKIAKAAAVIFITRTPTSDREEDKKAAIEQAEELFMEVLEDAKKDFKKLY
jgi:hypothetical protein